MDADMTNECVGVDSKGGDDAVQATCEDSNDLATPLRGDNKGDHKEQEDGLLGTAIVKGEQSEHPSYRKWQCSEKAFKRRVLKNVYVMGSVFALIFTSVAALVNLQSSLFMDQGLGVVCQCVSYVTIAVSSLFLPKVLISKLGHRWSTIVALTGYVIWLSANGYATWITMTSASVLVGCSASLLWTAFGSFLTNLAGQYANKAGRSKTQTISLFFGIGLGLLKTSRFFGPIIAWSVLQQEMRNASFLGDDDLKYCGSHDCPWLHTGNVYYEQPPNYLLWTLVAICVAIGLLAILVTFLLMDELPAKWFASSEETTAKKQIIDSLLAATKLHADIKQLLIIPGAVYTGISVSFIQADFNKSYVTCALGIWMVGLALIPNAILTTAVALTSGRIGKSLPQFLFGFLADCGLFVWCLLWKPRPEGVVVFFVTSGLFGVTSAVWHTQISALFGRLFEDKEAAMANCILWQSIGFAASFGMSRSLCVDVKIYTALATLTLAMSCLIALEILVRKNKKDDHLNKEETITKNNERC